MEQAPSQCILCNSSDRSVLIQQGDWIIKQCKGCGLGFLDPRPDSEALKRLYKDSYFDSQYDEGLPVNSPEMKRRVSQEDHRVKFLRYFKKSGKVVDLGCGRGYFLHACQLRGYSTEGIDISSDAAQYVMEELNIPVRVGNIDDIDFERNTVDIITMWHFLEHTSDPDLHIVKAKEWLKKDGILIVDVPNYEGTDARKMWDTWYGWQPPYHLFHFTPATLDLLLAKHGFEVRKRKDYHSEYVKERLKRYPIISLFARLIASRYSGTSYAVVATKE